MRFKGCIRYGVALAAATTVAATVGLGQALEVTFFRIATGSATGTYFPMASLIAGAISNPPGSRSCESGGSCGVPGLIAVAVTTQGSVENIHLIAKGAVESGFSQADVAYWAYHGTGLFAGKERFEDLRAIANLYPESVHVVVRRDSSIAKIADLKGKRIALGPRESGTVVDARLILKAFGIGARDFTASYLEPGEASDALRQGKIDAFFFVGGYPVWAVTNLAQDTPIDLLPIEGPRAERLLREQPFFSASIIPEDVYRGVEATTTLSVGAQWLVHASIDDDLVYGIVKSLWHKNTRMLLDAGHPRGLLVTLQTALDGIAIPLHEGAARFYREAGMLN